MAGAAVAPARSVRDLPPSIFAIVMATGIVALAVSAAGWPTGGHVLFWIGVSVYVVLWALTAIRGVYHWPAVRADLATHARAPGFFTIVAATEVLGSGSVVLHGAFGVARIVWAFAILLWVALTYTILPGLMESERNLPLERGLSGIWLLMVVATQSVCVLGSLVASHLPTAMMGPGLFVALIFWLAGGMLYLWLIVLIFYRLVFLPLTPAELVPSYWINLGAMAISALGGSSLVAVAGQMELLTELRPFLKGLTLLFWATATWWLPLLVMLGAWRHLVKRTPLVYDHGNWAMVFPLGMYAFSTLRLAREFGLPFLEPLGEVFAWVSLAAWAATAVGLGRHLARRLRGTSPR